MMRAVLVELPHTHIYKLPCCFSEVRNFCDCVKVFKAAFLWITDYETYFV